MSAVLKDAAELASMRERDLAEVMAIESAVYSHPWSRGNFADSLRAGYECRTLRLGTELVGYFILMVAAGEAHLLNLSIAAAHQRSARCCATQPASRARSAPATCFWRCGRATSARRRCTRAAASAGSASGAATILRRRDAKMRSC